MIYMGADKYENEDLIRYGIPEDLWLVMKLSSLSWLFILCEVPS